MQQYKNTVTTALGLPIEGATVTVTLAAGGAASLYSGNNTGALGSNVLTTGADGAYVFYADNGRYLLTIAAAGFAGATIDVVLYDPDDPGADTGYTGIWPDVSATTRMHRWRDRLFIGGGSAFTGNFSGTQGSFVPTSTEGANWAPRDSTVFVAQDFGLMAITGMVSNENMDLSGGKPTESIAVSAFAINKQATRTVWASYVDVQHHSGVASYGTEYAMKNLGADKTDTPYYTDGGVYGAWYAGGGDPSYGGAAANPSNTAIKIGKNASGGTTWNKGIVFVSDGLTGSDGSSGEATAIEMGYGHKISWRAPGNYSAFQIMAQVSGSGLNSSLFVGDGVMRFRGTTSLNILELAHQASAANYLQIINRAAGSAPRITAIGGDTNADVEVMGRGSSGVRLLDGAGVAQIRVNTTGIGFFNTAPVARPTGVAVSAAAIHASLVSLGLITA